LARKTAAQGKLTAVAASSKCPDTLCGPGNLTGIAAPARCNGADWLDGTRVATAPAAALDASGTKGRNIMSVGTILLIILILALLGALPSWPYSSGWGYYPSGGIGLVVLIVIILLLLGRI
jgi:hypothetical protein